MLLKLIFLLDYLINRLASLIFQLFDIFLIFLNGRLYLLYLLLDGCFLFFDSVKQSLILLISSQ
jgi:hypothetical protein